MNELIKVVPHETLTQAVSARELYLGLGLSEKQFVRWSELNILENSFVMKAVDFVDGNIMLPSNKEIMDYFVTLDFAKRLAMMARSVKGEEIRNYFIACEKELKAQQNRPLSIAEHLRLSADIYEEQERQALALEKVEADVHMIKCKQKAYEDGINYFTVMRYFIWKGLPNLDLKSAARIGRIATRISTEQNIPIDKVKDPRFGQVGCYHADILEASVEEFMNG